MEVYLIIPCIDNAVKCGIDLFDSLDEHLQDLLAAQRSGPDLGGQDDGAVQEDDIGERRDSNPAGVRLAVNEAVNPVGQQVQKEAKEPQRNNEKWRHVSAPAAFFLLLPFNFGFNFIEQTPHAKRRRS